MSDDAARGELDRIREEYAARDAAAPDPTYSWANPGYVFYMGEMESALLRALRNSGARLAGGRVLDVGCGSGYFLHRFVEYGAREGVGIEMMPARVEQARRRYPGLEIHEGSATEMPFDDESFDVVTQFTCLSSVLDPATRRAIAAEMWRVTRPGGWILSFDMRPMRGPVTWPARLGRLRARDEAVATHGTPTVGIGADELRALFPVAPAYQRKVSLHLDVATLLASRSRALAHAAALLPALRTHLLAILHKPAGS